MKALQTILLTLLISSGANAQIVINPDTIKEYKSATVPVYTKAYMNKYNRSKRLVMKVYPYALFAADIVDEIENNAAAIEKRRKRKKLYKSAYGDLKENFKYVILDMYTSEGQMLMKLIHRETKMTVYDIASKYRGKSKASVFAVMGKAFDQDIKSKFDPTGEDKITEHVIRDIDAGVIRFNGEAKMLKKEDYKEKEKKRKERIKKNKKNRKERAKKAKKKKKENKKSEKKKK